jgi:SAM-dependent methyltransferase
MFSSHCPLCGGEEFSFFLSAGPVQNRNNYDLLNCSSCGLVQTLRKGEDSTYPPELNYKSSEVQKSLIKWLEFFYINLRWKQEVYFLKKFLPDGAILLDVGSGNGLFLAELQRHKIYAEGIDKYIDMTSIAVNSVKIHKVDIESNHLPEKTYDCITLFHSLEHFKNPAHVLKKLRQVLNEGGLLLVQLPNIDSWQFMVFKKRWFHLFLPYHNYHFSTETLKKLLLNNGFSIVHVRHFSNRWNAEGWSASLLKKNPVWFLKAKSSGKGTLLAELIYFFVTILFFPLALLESLFKKGGVITVIARRNA